MDATGQKVIWCEDKMHVMVCFMLALKKGNGGAVPFYVARTSLFCFLLDLLLLLDGGRVGLSFLCVCVCVCVCVRA